MICDLDAEPTNKDFEFNHQNEKDVKLNQLSFNPKSQNYERKEVKNSKNKY